MLHIDEMKIGLIKFSRLTAVYVARSHNMLEYTRRMLHIALELSVAMYLFQFTLESSKYHVATGSYHV